MKIARTFQIMKPLKNLSVLDNVTAAAYFGHAGAKSEKRPRSAPWRCCTLPACTKSVM